jgi:DNA-binding HxlR family transcriptional regulator
MESDDRSFLRDAHNIMQLFGDKWTFPVMVTLAEGPLRRSEILKEVDSFCADADWLGASILHDSILTRTLRKLVGDGLLARHEAGNAFPPNVRYSLQPGAAAILEEFRSLQPSEAVLEEIRRISASSRNN